MSDTVTETPAQIPLAPANSDMVIATSDMISHLESDSYMEIPGFPGLDLRMLDHLEKHTNGQFGGTMFRRQAGTPWLHDAWHMHHLDFQFSYVLQGSLVLEMEGVGPVTIEAGGAVYQPGMNRHRTAEMSEDCIAIEISSPAKFRSTVYIWDDEAGEYTTVTIDTIDEAEAVLGA